MYAVIVGINYEGTSNQLNGCINDAENILSFLKDEYDFVDDSHHLMYMTDHTLDLRPSYHNIVEALKWLCTDRVEGDRLFFSFSGHGSRLRDREGDERDGRDEVLIPIDFLHNGGKYVVDDEIRRIINNLPENSSFFSICDCCHSGTSFDLRYTYKGRQGGRSMIISKDNRYERTNANVMVISGCTDQQTSADTVLPDPEDGKKEHQGALTGTLLSIMRDDDGQKTIESTMNKLTVRLRQGRYTQQPQLTSGRVVDYDDDFGFM